MAIFRRGPPPPLTGASSAGGVGTSILDEYVAIGSMNAAVRDQQLTVIGAVCV